MTISESSIAVEGSLIWTLEEIGRLVSQSGKPAETLSQHRGADPTAVRDRRLLGLSARARPNESGLGGDGRSAAREHRPGADAAQ